LGQRRWVLREKFRDLRGKGENIQVTYGQKVGGGKKPAGGGLNHKRGG